MSLSLNLGKLMNKNTETDNRYCKANDLLIKQVI